MPEGVGTPELEGKQLEQVVGRQLEWVVGSRDQNSQARE